MNTLLLGFLLTIFGFITYYYAPLQFMSTNWIINFSLVLNKILLLMILGLSIFASLL